MNPIPASVHVNVPLTQFSVAFIQEQSRFIADQVFPNIQVSKQSDRYYTYDRGFFNRDAMKLRAPATETAGTVYTVDNTPTYYCDVWGIHHDIPDQRVANADSVLDLDKEATILVTQKAWLRREISWMSRFFIDGVWATKFTGVNASPAGVQRLRWNDTASDPVRNVQDASTLIEESTGFVPNTLVISRHVLNALRVHPGIIDRIKYGQTPGAPAQPTTSDLAQLFEVERVLVARAISNTAGEGQTNAHSFIAGKHALLCYSAPQPGLMTPSAGYTMNWTGYDNLAGDGGQSIRRFRMEHLRSTRVELEMTMDQKLVAAELGHFFETIVA